MFWLALAGCMLALPTRATSFQDEREDSVVNVIAYFCKGDTMKYTYTDAVYRIADGDTATSSYYSRDCMIVVTDSTSKGYKMEMTPLQITLANDSSAEATRTQMNLAILKAFEGVKIKFRTDEWGDVQGIENWREVKDLCLKGLKKVFDEMYQKASGLDSFMPRKRLEKFMKQALSSEEDVRQCVEEIPLLFGCHGSQFKVGTTALTDTTGLFPIQRRAWVAYADEEDGLGNDYSISMSSITSVPPKEAAQLMGVVLAGLLSDEAVDKADEMFTDSLSSYFSDSLKVDVWEDYHFFANGWPSRMQQMKSSGFSKQKKVECKSIDWYYRSWKGYAMKDEAADAQ